MLIVLDRFSSHILLHTECYHTNVPECKLLDCESRGCHVHAHGISAAVMLVTGRISGWQRVCRVARMAAEDGLPSRTVCTVLASSQVDCSAEASPSALIEDTSLYDTRHAFGSASHAAL